MTIRSRGPSAGLGWLKRSIGVSYRHPKPLLGGAALLALMSLLPTLVMLPMRLHSTQAGTSPNLSAIVFSMAGSMVFSLLLVPLYAGYLQVIDAAERGLPARARDIFGPYRQGEALRVLGYALVRLLIYAAFFGIVIFTAGGGIVGWYMQLLTAQVSHQPPPALPHGFGTAFALGALLGLFMMAFNAIALGQIALGRRSIFGAIGDGAVGALKNLLPLLVFVLCMVLALILALVAMVLLAIPIALLGVLAGPWLVLALTIPLYLVLMLAMFAVMFGVMYHLWRDVCGDDTAMAQAPPITA